LSTNRARVLSARAATVVAGVLLFVSFGARPASAIPLFAQRYHMKCTVCHSVLPELNAFGNFFRNHGYRIPKAPKYRTTIAALRYQMEYEKDPPSGQRRWTPGGILLSNADLGRISYYLHYNLGAGGGPSAVYLGYLTAYNEHTDFLYRAGYIELPLIQSPGQRLDELAPYGYDQTRVGLNDLTLASPRLGIEAAKDIGALRLDATMSFGEFKGAAYGGKPIFTGEDTYPGRPELGLFATIPALKDVTLFSNLLFGQRAIGVTGQPTFQDAYQRYGFGADLREHALDFTLQQWYGFDGDADGVGDSISSSGGFARLKYYVTPHLYVAARYDTTANPFISRDMVYYIGTQAGTHARVVLQDVHTIGLGKNALGGALTFGFPWPLGY
jgi:hypothetical protein